jgi:hypothetical protein
VLQHTGQPGRTAASDVAQRAGGARGEQVVAVPREHRGPGVERAHHAGLADAGLPGEQYDRTGAGGGPAQRRLQDVERLVALEQAGGHRAATKV